MECPFCQTEIGSYSKHCKACGKLIPPGQHLLEESGVIEPSRPLALAGNKARAHHPYRFARLGDRFIAFVLDSTFLFGVFAVVDALAFMRWGSVEGTELQLTAASLLIAITFNALLLVLYGSMLETAWGATLGKAIVGIRVVGTSSRGRSLSACAVRNVLRIVDGMGFYLVGAFVAGCSSVRQRVGDISARTVVIEERFESAPRVAAIMLWIASLAAATWAVPRICRTNHFVRPAFLNQVIIQVGESANSAYVRVGGLSVNVRLNSSAEAANQ